MPAAAIIPAVATIGAAVIGSNAAKHAGQQAAQQQQSLSNQSFQQQTNYVQQQQDALRNAILGIVGQGNPYLNAGSQLPGPSYLPGGTFGGQQYGPQSQQPSQPSGSNPPALGLIGEILRRAPGLTPGASGSGATHPPIPPSPLPPLPAPHQIVTQPIMQRLPPNIPPGARAHLGLGGPGLA